MEQQQYQLTPLIPISSVPGLPFHESNTSSITKKETTKKSTKPTTVTCTKRDVLMGRGKRVSLWPGNIYFRQMVSKYRKTYAVADRWDKAAVAADVIKEIYNKNGRFLREYNGRSACDGKDRTAVWVVVDYARAIEKTCQALREQKNNKNDNFSNDEQQAVANNIFAFTETKTTTPAPKVATMEQTAENNYAFDGDKSNGSYGSISNSGHSRGSKNSMTSFENDDGNEERSVSGSSSSSRDVENDYVHKHSESDGDDDDNSRDNDHTSYDSSNSHNEVEDRPDNDSSSSSEEDTTKHGNSSDGVKRRKNTSSFDDENKNNVKKFKTNLISSTASIGSENNNASMQSNVEHTDNTDTSNDAAITLLPPTQRPLMTPVPGIHSTLLHPKQVKNLKQAPVPTFVLQPQLPLPPTAFAANEEQPIPSTSISCSNNLTVAVDPNKHFDQEMLSNLREFYTVHGHTFVPSNHDRILADWCIKQRQIGREIDCGYRDFDLDLTTVQQETYKDLREINFFTFYNYEEWHWHYRYNQLVLELKQQQQQQHLANDNSPNKNNDQSSSSKISGTIVAWLQDQRRQYAQDGICIPSNRLKQLEQLGIFFH